MDIYGQWDGFFSSKQGDRKYSDKDFAAYFSSFISNGVYSEPADNLQIVTGTEIGKPETDSKGNYILYALPGKAFINGYAYASGINLVEIIYNEVYELRSHPRIDRIVLRWDNNQRRIYFTVSRGMEAASPVPPDINNYRNNITYDLGAAEISLSVNAVNISQADIRDTRPFNDVCGWVRGLPGTVTADGFFRQFEEQWNILINSLGDDNHIEIINVDVIAREMAEEAYRRIHYQRNRRIISNELREV